MLVGWLVEKWLIECSLFFFSFYCLLFFLFHSLTVVLSANDCCWYFFYCCCAMFPFRSYCQNILSNLRKYWNHHKTYILQMYLSKVSIIQILNIIEKKNKRTFENEWTLCIRKKNIYREIARFETGNTTRNQTE